MMKKHIFIKSVLLTLLPAAIITACATGFNDSKPGSFQLRPYKEVQLDNGLRLLLVEDHSLPRIDLNMMFLTGSLNDDDLPGINHFTAKMLEQGTSKRSATQLAQEFGQIAADFGSSSGDDYTNFSSSTLTTKKMQLLDLFADTILNPAFSGKEIARERAQTLAFIQHAADNPSHYADELLDREVFGKHPYSHPSLGEAQTVQQISRTDIVKHYFKYYRPNNAILAVTGDIDDNYVEQIKAAFAKWQKRDLNDKHSNLNDSLPVTGIQLYTKPGLQQTQIRFGHRGLRRNDKDYLAARIANLILGGDFVSRLNSKIRDELGLTYSIQSSFAASADPGMFDISTFTRNDKVAATISETRAVIEKFVREGATAKELDDAKALLAGQFPAAIETTDKLAYNLQVLRRYGVSDNYLSNFNANLQAVSLSQVNEAIRKYFHPDLLQTVVYGDASVIGAQLQTLGVVNTHQVTNPSSSQ